MMGRSISLLFGFPITPAEFALRLQCEPGAASDYLARFSAQGLDEAAWRAHVDEMWRTDYGPWAAAPYAALAQRASEMGCDVRHAATLADLAAAARPGRIVVMISHWKGARFMNDDFLPGLAAGLDPSLKDRPGPLAAWVRAAIKPPPRLLGLWRKAPLRPKEALRAALSARIAEALPDGVARIEELPTTQASRRREQLDGWLDGQVRPGNRLELFDGLHSREAVAEAVAGLSGGVLDLTVCNGAYLGDYVRSRTDNRFRTVQPLLPQDPTEAAVRLGSVLKLVAEDGWDYLDARLEVARMFPIVVEAEARSRREALT